MEIYNISVLGKTDHCRGLVLPAYSITFTVKTEKGAGGVFAETDDTPYFKHVTITSVMNNFYKANYPATWAPEVLKQRDALTAQAIADKEIVIVERTVEDTVST